MPAEVAEEVAPAEGNCQGALGKSTRRLEAVVRAEVVASICMEPAEWAKAWPWRRGGRSEEVAAMTT